MMNNFLFAICLYYIATCIGYSVIHRHRLTISWWERSVWLVSFESHLETVQNQYWRRSARHWSFRQLVHVVSITISTVFTGEQTSIIKHADNVKFREPRDEGITIVKVQRNRSDKTFRQRNECCISNFAVYPGVQDYRFQIVHARTWEWTPKVIGPMPAVLAGKVIL